MVNQNLDDLPKYLYNKGKSYNCGRIRIYLGSAYFAESIVDIDKS